MLVRLFRYWRYTLLSFGVLAVTVFLFPHMMPGHPLQFYESWPSHPQQRARLTNDYGFDRMLPLQGMRWMQRLLTGQWGASRYSQRPVFDECWPALLRTGLLLLWTLLACGLGIGSLWCLSRLAPWVLELIPYAFLLRVLAALPGFLAAILVRELLLWPLGWAGILSLPLVGPSYVLHPAYMFLPASFCALLPLRLWYDLPCAAPDQPWTVRQRWYRVRTAFHPYLNMFLLDVTLTEYVCTFPGLGSLGIKALQQRDLPLVQGFILCMGGLYVVLRGLCGEHHPPALSVHTPSAPPAPTAVYRTCWCLLLLGLLTLCSPWLLRYEPTAIHSRDQHLPPGYRYVLGTDFLGRDVLSRTVQGFRHALPRVLVLAAISGGLSWAVLWSLSRSQRWTRLLWDGGRLVSNALPSFVLACMVFLLCEQQPWALEMALILACLPTEIGNLTPHATWLQRVTHLTQLSGWLLLLDVTFAFVHLSPDSFAPTWGSELRHGMHYGHINSWMLLAPTTAIVWSRYSVSQPHDSVACVPSSALCGHRGA